MPEKTTVALRIAESVKNEWEAAAEGPEYDTLSHLIRLAVQREIAGDCKPQAAQEDEGSDSTGEVLQQLSQIERSIAELQETTDIVREDIQAEAASDLEQVLFEVLPTASMDVEAALEDYDIEQNADTPQEVAKRIGADATTVTDVLKRLEANTAAIRSVSNRAGETFYWRWDQ